MAGIGQGPRRQGFGRGRDGRWRGNHNLADAPQEGEDAERRGRGVNRGRGGGKRGRYENEIRPMGFKRLQDLRELDSCEILTTLSNSRSGFKEVLSFSSLKPDWVSSILEIIASACCYESSPKMLIELLNTIKNSTFLTVHLNTYIVRMTTEPSVAKQEMFRDPLKNAMKLLKCLLLKMPNSYVQVLPVVVTTDYVARSLRAGTSVVDGELESLLGDVKAMAETLQDTSFQKTAAEGTYDEATNPDFLVPPNDFRNISIFPQQNDIQLDEEPFLRANKECGKFVDVDHYLDVQFRLLREDFVAPLRDGITEFKQQRAGKADPHHRLKDIRLYFDVHVLNPVCSHNGILHRISFDTTRLKKVRWETTKRLIFGSLVCLSKDEFQTMLFASVSNRDPKKLAEGNLEVKFEHDHELVSSINPEDKFLMAETSAYFESYRHVLQGLQYITPDNFPFKKYIVECVARVMPPSYLVGDGVKYYDLRPLAEQNPSKLENYQERLENLNLQEIHEQVNQHELLKDADKTKNIPILNILKWPAPEVLHVDESQYRALQTALTKEFAIIQGPPGTGKTYVGLKIVQGLLHNKILWSTGLPEQKGPILVVCYTNHALDQFLEGIQKFHDKNIVRVGGRSKSTSLEKYMLKNLRQDVRKDKSVPRAVYEGKLGLKYEMDRIEKTISHTVAKIEATERGIIQEDILESMIDEQHFFQLTEHIQVPAEAKTFLNRGQTQPSVITDWLGLEGIIYQEYSETSDSGGGNDLEMEDDSDDDDEKIDVEDEMAVMQQHRMLEDDEENFHTLHQRRTEESARRLNQEMANRDLAFNLEDIEQTSEMDQGGEFQVVKRNKKKMCKEIRKGLRSSDNMNEDEEAKVKNVWALKVADRWRLYRLWLVRYRKALKKNISAEERQFQACSERLEEVKHQEDLFVMRKSDVLGMTTTGAARYRDVLQEIKPRIVVVEEAAEVLEAHIMSSLSNGCQHIILIGDHKQLRPTPTVYRLAKKFKLDISLFERMVNNGMNCITLELQHRMRPTISKLMEPIYPNLKDHDSVMEYEDIKGVKSNIFFIDHIKEEHHDEELRSHSNFHEVKFVTALCRYLMLQGYSASQITILTTYTGQIFQFRHHMPKSFFNGVRLCSVDNFQGEENDIIILSLVRSNPEGNIGFLSIENRVCVSLSRAKKGFFVIGNFEMLAKRNELWSKIVGIVRKQGCMGQALPLYCQNHPNKKGIMASSAKDFEKSPEGGCLEPCETRLLCGHVCPRACHTYDRDHKSFKCMKPCAKVLCENNHVCRRKCHEKCGECMVMVEKEMPHCGHKQKMPCSKNPFLFKCRSECYETLDCGHQCQERCGEQHTVKCKKEYQRIWPCSHIVKALCYQTPENFPCNKPCKTLLECGHECKGTCGMCRQGRLHAACVADCGRTIVCGHQCKEPCTKNCPPCKDMCHNRCIHSKCSRPCGQPCLPCNEPCTWQCAHYQCSKLCSQPCDRPSCNKPCSKFLECGHRCVGLCGEPCPKLCRICNKQELEEILFGTEDEPGARFVQLEDCGHVLEVSGLDHWMATENTKADKDIQLKVCPKCKTPIRKNRRYGNIINEQLADIEKVKRLILGHPDDLKREIEKLTQDAQPLKIADHQASADVLARLANNSLNQDELILIENQIIFLNRLASLRKKNAHYVSRFTGSLYLKYVELAKSELSSLRKWLLTPRPRVSDQQLKEFAQEVERISLLQKVTILAQVCNTKKDYMHNITVNLQLLDEPLKLLTDGNPLTSERETKIKKIYEKAKKNVPLDTLGIDEEEKKMIVQAMGLQKGHWFKCPNNHVYAIGDCGGATVEAKCPECNATIGGAGHQLRSDNALAPEMDGARYAAFSDQANLQNYGFNERI